MGRFSLYQDLTVEENLRSFDTLFGTKVEENYDSIKAIYTQIEPFRKTQGGEHSRRHETEADTLLRTGPPAEWSCS